jgi:hypothetical protein
MTRGAQGMGRYRPHEIAELVDAARRDGFCLLRDHVPAATVRAWADAFAPLLEAYVARGDEPANRGPGRYYITLPFRAPFADPSVFADDDVFAIAEGLVGDDPVVCQLATDTPVLGSDYQEIHRDAQPLFPETGAETPAFQLAVNFPLVDVTEERGPFEVARGTHMMAKEEGLARIAAGEIALEPVLMSAGDVMIRDVRGLHRGTPNRSGTPRPMVVVGYSRKWLFRPEVSIRIPRGALDALGERARRLLRYNPVVDALDDAPGHERYRSFAY